MPSEQGGRERPWWAVIVSGAEGRKVRRLALRVFDRERPHHYYPSEGGQGLIEQTVKRATCLVPPERIFTVIGNGHGAHIDPVAQLPGRILEEPADRGTGASLFLPLAYVLAQDPNATVLILPCDHLVLPDAQVVPQVERAGYLAELMPNRLVILAAAPTRPQADLGWVEPGPVLDLYASFGARSVKRFYEKPGTQEAESFFRRGFFWNTMIMAVKARTMWAIGQELFPGMIKRFENLLDLLKLVKSGNASRDLEGLALRDVYRGLETTNFSRRVLQLAPEWITLLPLANLSWSDWGHPAGNAESEAPSTQLRLA
ncbi:MAG: hypothetical protein EHM61_02235 [Acidobacteria bacterium]|nr:MAG: hypothetical protein EHM61_02235 [Acidobacteriota bacterium]